MTNKFTHDGEIQDLCFSLLLDRNANADASQLVIADENVRHSNLKNLPRNQTTLVTNRYDIFEQGQTLGLNVFFNDFDLSIFPDNSFTKILFRVSKEKALTHYIIKNSYRLLAANGSLIISGAKSDGIKTYAEKASEHFGAPVKIRKNGLVYLAAIQRLSEQESALPKIEIDDKNYARLSTHSFLFGKKITTKPGVFGWDKIDEGSAYLGDFLPEFLSLFDKDPLSILDLGCGYGYLSMRVSRITKAKIIATDNNAAAILACSKNFSTFAINGSVIADNCARNIKKSFNAIICNPPFHKGFNTDSQLSQQFLLACYEHLEPKGMALFVVNRFIPLEKYTQKLFKTKLMAANSSFKLILLTK